MKAEWRGGGRGAGALGEAGGGDRAAQGNGGLLHPVPPPGPFWATPEAASGGPNGYWLTDPSHLYPPPIRPVDNSSRRMGVEGGREERGGSRERKQRRLAGHFIRH